MKLYPYGGELPCDFCKGEATLRGALKTIAEHGRERAVYVHLCDNRRGKVRQPERKKSRKPEQPRLFP